MIIDIIIIGIESFNIKRIISSTLDKLWKRVNCVLLLSSSLERFCLNRDYIIEIIIGEVSCEEREGQETESSPWLPASFSSVNILLIRFMIYVRNISNIDLLWIRCLWEYFPGLYSWKMSLEIAEVMIERIKIVIINCW